jgi:hypothetical protein
METKDQIITRLERAASNNWDSANAAQDSADRYRRERDALREALASILDMADRPTCAEFTAHALRIARDALNPSRSNEEPGRTTVWQETKNNLPAIGAPVILCNPNEFENYPFDDRSRCRQEAAYFNVIGGVGCWSIFGRRSVPLVSFPYWAHMPTLPESDIE